MFPIIAMLHTVMDKEYRENCIDKRLSPMGMQEFLISEEVFCLPCCPS